jgi:hypothetical protein
MSLAFIARLHLILVAVADIMGTAWWCKRSVAGWDWEDHNKWWFHY